MLGAARPPRATLVHRILAAVVSYDLISSSDQISCHGCPHRPQADYAHDSSVVQETPFRLVCEGEVRYRAVVNWR